MKTRQMLIAVVLIAVLLSACGGAAGPAASGKFRVAVIMPSATTDMAFSQSMFQALKTMQAEARRRSQLRDQVFGEYVQRAGCAGRDS